MQYSGWMIATTINLMSAIALGIYMNVPVVSFPFVAARDVYRGFTGEPAEMHYRPDWANFMLRCGEGGECDD